MREPSFTAFEELLVRNAGRVDGIAVAVFLLVAALMAWRGEVAATAILGLTALALPAVGALARTGLR